MGFKTGLIVGFGFGYVKGSKAGRERYEQIKRNWKKVQATEAYDRASEKLSAAVGLGVQRGKEIAFGNLMKNSSRRSEEVFAGRNGPSDLYSR
jgi:hypothetical protein